MSVVGSHERLRKQIRPTAAEALQRSADNRMRYGGWALLALFFMSVVMLQVLQKSRGGSDLSGDGDLFRQAGYVLIFGFAAYALRIGDDLRKLVAMPLSLLLLMGLCWLSLLWSLEPGIAFRRLVLTTIIVVTCFMAVNNAGTERSIRLLQSLLALCLAFNFVVLATSPAGVHLAGETGDPALAGNWRGFTMQKNFAGALCAITVIFFAFKAVPGRPWLNFAIIVGSAVFLWFSQSKTSLYLLLPSLLSGWLYLRLTRAQIRVVIPVVALTLIIFAILGDTLMAQVGELFAEPDAFTGRAQIWPILLEYANTRPLIGSGFGSFWNVGPASPVFQMSYSWVAELGNGHNGYLDVLVQLGYPGMLLAIWAVILLPGWKLLTRTTIEKSTGALLISLLLFCAGNNFTESTLLDRDMMVWVFMVFIVAMEHKANIEGQARQITDAALLSAPPRRARGH